MTLDPKMYLSISVPENLRNGLIAMMVRHFLLKQVVGNEYVASQAAREIMTALYGFHPTFAQIQSTSKEDFEKATQKAGISGIPVAGFKELPDVWHLVNPETPMCSHCGDVPLSNNGSFIQNLVVGSKCPFCHVGEFVLIPMTLKKITWTDGRLVDPSMREDYQFITGEQIPLDDDLIMDWVNVRIQPDLKQALVEAQVSIYGFLAYANLVRNAFSGRKESEEGLCKAVGWLLEDPEVCNLPVSIMAEEAMKARQYVEEREVTNMPRILKSTSVILPVSSVVATVVNPFAPMNERDPTSYIRTRLLASGDMADIYLGHLNDPFADKQETVIIKVYRDAEDTGMARNEAQTLERLYGSAETEKAEGFLHGFPKVLAYGPVTDSDGVVHECNVFSYTPGYMTLEEVCRDDHRVDIRTGVWMFNRILEMLGWIHQHGIILGSVLPSHILAQLDEHWIVFLGWPYAVHEPEKTGARILAVSQAYESFYPESVFRKKPPSPAMDISMAARCVIQVVGGDPITGKLPRGEDPLFETILKTAAGLHGSVPFKNAWQLHEAFGEVARSVLGPRKFHPSRVFKKT